ncbi:hypothetical protein FHX06_006550 [Rhizobium sp. BK512]|uniref:RT0821/Lpp0805 family surface protein n=1 Tax=Rhizobium sp. BK512 TaxID=2587010 RepID=UPI00180905BD|nr:RT0821/Lpp0805 family surface protein [Rhizobium sp. BK512]MBB3565180.1 hypothetical protein [Rhizobium sp. BK512]
MQKAKRFIQQMNPKHFITAMGAAPAACSQVEPLETPLARVPLVAPVADQAVIANTVGRGPVGATALAWANPSTGSVGVIEEIDASIDGRNGCRGFVTSRQSLDGITRFNGFACPSGDSWKLTDR